LQRAQELIVDIMDNDPRYSQLRNVSGLTARAEEARLLTISKLLQDNPLVRQAGSDLSEMGVSYAQYISGMKGRVAASILDRTTRGLPSLDATLLEPKSGQTWVEALLKTALSTRLPDLPSAVGVQLESMKDTVRAVQEAVIESSG